MFYKSKCGGGGIIYHFTFCSEKVLGVTARFCMYHESKPSQIVTKIINVMY